MSRDRLLLKAEMSNTEVLGPRRPQSGYPFVLGSRVPFTVSNLHKETKKNFSHVIKGLYNYGSCFLSWFLVISDMLFIVKPKTGRSAHMISKEMVSPASSLKAVSEICLLALCATIPTVQEGHERPHRLCEKGMSDRTDHARRARATVPTARLGHEGFMCESKIKCGDELP